MLKLLTALVLCAGLVLPAAYARDGSGASKVERTLLAQANSGPAGTVTRSVHCTPGGRHAYDCTLRSVRSTTLDAHAVVRDGHVETSWSPLRG